MLIDMVMDTVMAMATAARMVATCTETTIIQMTLPTNRREGKITEPLPN
jgi:hypothetical protein